MKKTLFLAAMIAAMMVAMPADAQSRKDKKAARKAQWEQQQKQSAEEAELRHKMRMDSIANAKKEAEEKAKAAAAKQAQREKEQQEMEDLQRQIKLDSLKRVKEANQWKLEETTLNEPCMDTDAPDGFYRARGIGEQLSQQTARTIAHEYAMRDLAAKFASAIKTLISMQLANDRTIAASSAGTSLDQFVDGEKLDGMTQREVKATLTGAKPTCEETRTYMHPQLHRKMYKTYMVLEVSEEKCLKPLYEQIEKETNNQLNMRYDEFKEEFNKHFNE